MSILLDECVPRRYLRLLTGWDYSASLLSQHVALASPDTAVIALAQTLDAVLLTIDLDFSNMLDYPPQNYQGIIILRDQQTDELTVTATFKQALQDLYRDDLRGVLVIVSPNRYRIRRGTA